jgi:Raf kinase inhibitor-like YbhB/YbcL family protein
MIIRSAIVARIVWWPTVAAVLLAAGCGGQTSEEPAMGTFSLTSPAFKHDERMPDQYTGKGADVSPPLAWGEPPAGTQSLALICDDPDAPHGTWDHWVIWNLPADLRQLPEKMPTSATLDDFAGASQGNNSWPTVGYKGPMPPPGKVHHYNFVLYALDAPLDLEPGANKKALLATMKGHILGEARLTGTYSQ